MRRPAKPRTNSGVEVVGRRLTPRETPRLHHHPEGPTEGPPQPQPFSADFIGLVHQAVEAGRLSQRKAARLLGMQVAEFADLWATYGHPLSCDIHWHPLRRIVADRTVLLVDTNVIIETEASSRWTLLLPLVLQEIPRLTLQFSAQGRQGGEPNRPGLVGFEDGEVRKGDSDAFRQLGKGHVPVQEHAVQIHVDRHDASLPLHRQRLFFGHLDGLPPDRGQHQNQEPTQDPLRVNLQGWREGDRGDLDP